MRANLPAYIYFFGRKKLYPSSDSLISPPNKKYKHFIYIYDQFSTISCVIVREAVRGLALGVGCRRLQAICIQPPVSKLGSVVAPLPMVQPQNYNYRQVTPETQLMRPYIEQTIYIVFNF